jgi:hypothetical protein
MQSVTAVLAARWPCAAAATCLSAGTSLAVIGYLRGDPVSRILVGILAVATVAVAAILIRTIDHYCDRTLRAPPPPRSSNNATHAHSDHCGR